MAQYRFYLIKSDGGVARFPIIIECRDDEEALARGRSYAAQNAVEVWMLDRRIAQIASLNAS